MKKFQFDKNSEIVPLAKFVSALEREGIAYSVEWDNYYFYIIITGF